MCKLCNGTGGVTLQRTWGAEYLPCNHPECDFDRQKAENEMDTWFENFKAEIKAKECEVS